jgi:transposase-like protein
MQTLTCPKCNSQVIKRNGYTRHGKQNLRCLECGRQFSIEPERTEAIPEESNFFSEEPLIR